MAKEPKIFRKVALERLSSPEQLDQLMQVTSPKGWIALSSLLLLLGLGVLWSVLGSIPTTANGEGLVLRRGGVSELVANGSGQVEEILVTVGDAIEKGQIVARIRQEGMERKISDAEARINALQGEMEELERYADEQIRLSAANEAQKRANLERSIETLEKQLSILRENYDVQKDLLNDGLITQQTLLAKEQEINQARDQLAAQRLELNGLELQRLELEQQLQQQMETRRAQRRDLELTLREAQASLTENVEIRAAVDGRVLELMISRGDVVSPGTPLMTLEESSEELMAVVFVPAALGKQVAPGMTAQVTPSTVKKEEYGFILGEVTWVAEFPSTSRGMQRLLGNQELVARLMEEGTPIQVDVRLEKSDSTPTGFQWSSSTGPDLEISSGTLAEGSVIVRRVRPISLLIPKVREKLGI